MVDSSVEGTIEAIEPFGGIGAENPFKSFGNESVRRASCVADCNNCNDVGQ